ncbi:hypothetical protein BaRGS_00017850 [Batillaria attramentaria]|uniref:Uncharacterized protein n=1 Tax=Batillaria attramentaria TaxID=370345 RepID=A0ABD0KV52_9CAEN
MRLQFYPTTCFSGRSVPQLATDTVSYSDHRDWSGYNSQYEELGVFDCEQVLHGGNCYTGAAGCAISSSSALLLLEQRDAGLSTTSLHKEHWTPSCNPQEGKSANTESFFPSGNLVTDLFVLPSGSTLVYPTSLILGPSHFQNSKAELQNLTRLTPRPHWRRVHASHTTNAQQPPF